ncbi:hypothetical protein GCM10023334_106880 [Nonomuraea thailandensis]
MPRAYADRRNEGLGPAAAAGCAARAGIKTGSSASKASTSRRNSARTMASMIYVRGPGSKEEISNKVGSDLRKRPRVTGW